MEPEGEEEMDMDMDAEAPEADEADEAVLTDEEADALLLWLTSYAPLAMKMLVTKRWIWMPKR